MKNQQLNFNWIKFLNITAKILTIFCISIISLIFISEGFTLNHLTTRDIVLSICFFGVVIGMIISWFNVKIGALLTLMSLFAFYLVHFGFSVSFPRGPYFLLFSFPGFLFLAQWILEKKIK